MSISNKAIIHSSSIIAEGASIDEGCEIGAFTIIGSNVKLSKNVKIMSSVILDGDIEIGEGTVVYPFTTIGLPPQDLKYRNEETKIIIGKNNVIREHVTIHLGTSEEKSGKGVTKIGDDCLIMVGVHVAHDVAIGNNVIISNNTLIAGHVLIGDYAIIGGGSAIHQFCRVGAYSFIGGMSGVVADIIPFALFTGVREKGRINGVNVVGLRRRGFTNIEIRSVKAVYEHLFSSNKNVIDAVLDVEAKYKNNRAIETIIGFVKNTLASKSRSLCTNYGIQS